MNDPVEPAATADPIAASPETVLPFRIGADWRTGDEPPIRCFDPGDGTLVATVASATVRDVDEAVALAAAAWRAAAAEGADAEARAPVLRRIGDRLLAERPALATLLARDCGEPLARAEATVAEAAARFHYCAALCATWHGDPLARDGRMTMTSRLEPLGVVAALSGAVSPLLMAARQLAPALAAGNAVILKPSSHTPLAALELGRIAHEAGVAEGLVTVLPGNVDDVGTALLKHPDVGLVAWAGSTRGARLAGTTTGNRLVSLVVDLAGHGGCIVCDDHGFDEAVDAVAATAFETMGRGPVAGGRLFIDRALYSRFVDALVERAKALAPARAALPTTRLGPLATAGRRRRAEQAIERSRVDGGKVLAGGRPPAEPALAAGHFLLPTVIEGPPVAARATLDDLAAPLLWCLPFRDDADLVDQVGASLRGQPVALWSGDDGRARALVEALGIGAAWLNPLEPPVWPAAVGASRAAGTGRETGAQGVRLYCGTRDVFAGRSAGGPR